MNKSELDEMQLQKRNKIGNQSFMLLFYLLMIDIGLNGFGIHWLKYPTNVFVIMLLCMACYLVRIIWNNAYLGPANNKSVNVRVAVVMAIAALVAGLAGVLSQKNLIQVTAADEGDNGALILFIVSTVSLIIAAIVGFINYRRNRKDDL